jgi:hypothetical protein
MKRMKKSKRIKKIERSGPLTCPSPPAGRRT